MITKKFYTSNIPYLFNHYIREYDIKQANINVLYQLGKLSKEKYDFLANAPRDLRQIYIGKMLKDNESLSNALSNGIMGYKKELFDSNGIEDFDILSIKNDAVFIIDKIPKITKFGNVEFVPKNIYSSFMKLDRLEVYYYSKLDHEQIDIKGIKETDIELYHMAFLEIVLEFLRTMKVHGPAEALDLINEIIMKYLNKELGIEYYRNFRPSSEFLMNSLTSAYGIKNMPKDHNIDINYNLFLLRQMQTYASKCLYEQINKG